MAADDLDVGAAHIGRDRALHAAFEAVELAGQQRLEPDLVILDLEQFEPQALALGKPALRRHQQETRVGFRRDDAVPPGLRCLRRSRRRGGEPGRDRDQGKIPKLSGVDRVHATFLKFGARGDRIPQVGSQYHSAISHRS